MKDAGDVEDSIKEIALTAAEADDKETRDDKKEKPNNKSDKR